MVQHTLQLGAVGAGVRADLGRGRTAPVMTARGMNLAPADLGRLRPDPGIGARRRDGSMLGADGMAGPTLALRVSSSGAHGRS